MMVSLYDWNDSMNNTVTVSSLALLLLENVVPGKIIYMNRVKSNKTGSEPGV